MRKNNLKNSKKPLTSAEKYDIIGAAAVVIPFLTVGVYKNRKYIKEHGFAGGSSVEADVKYEISCSEAAPSTAVCG